MQLGRSLFWGSEPQTAAIRSSADVRIRNKRAIRAREKIVEEVQHQALTPLFLLFEVTLGR